MQRSAGAANTYGVELEKNIGKIVLPIKNFVNVSKNGVHLLTKNKSVLTGKP